MVNTGCVELCTVTTFTVRSELYDRQERKETAKIQLLPVQFLEERKETAKIQLLPVQFLERFVKGERSFVLTIFLGFSAQSSFYFLRDFSKAI